MSKSKRNNNRKPSRPAALPTFNALDLEITEFECFLNALDSHYYADKWDQKHRLIEVDINGNVLSVFPIPSNVRYDQVIPLIPLRENTFALVFFSEGWQGTNAFVRPSLDPNRVEVRTGVWVDKVGRTFSGMKKRGEQSITVNIGSEFYGREFDVLRKALGQHAEVPKFMKMFIALKVFIDVSHAQLANESEPVLFPFEKLFASSNYEDVLVSAFAHFAEMFNEANELGLTNELEKQHEFAQSVPFVAPLELELELRALLPEGYELPTLFCSDEASLV